MCAEANYKLRSLKNSYRLQERRKLVGKQNAENISIKSVVSKTNYQESSMNWPNWENKLRNGD